MISYQTAFSNINFDYLREFVQQSWQAIDLHYREPNYIVVILPDDTAVTQQDFDNLIATHDAQVELPSQFMDRRSSELVAQFIDLAKNNAKLRAYLKMTNAERLAWWQAASQQDKDEALIGILTVLTNAAIAMIVAEIEYEDV